MISCLKLVLVHPWVGQIRLFKRTVLYNVFKTKFESSGTDELRATRQLTEATADLS